MDISAKSALGVMNVVVLGAGVVGLSTAITIQEDPLFSDTQVTIVAEILPGDTMSIGYTSWWAGAHHVSYFGQDEQQQEMDLDTLKVLFTLESSDNDAAPSLLRLRQSEYFSYDLPEGSNLDTYPNASRIPRASLPADASSGIAFDTLTIDPSRYLPYLLRRFEAKGGKCIRTSVAHIRQLFTVSSPNTITSSPPDALVLCPGLGAHTLGGVQDADVFPVRGQTVLVRAPWVSEGCSLDKDGSAERTYVIPRKSGTVVLGGTREENDWHLTPRPETTTTILTRVLSLYPEILPEDAGATAKSPSEKLDALRALIVAEAVGLRPARKAGMRLETFWVDADSGGRVPVVCNYGHGGAGYQTSWGSARIAKELLASALMSAPSTDLAS